MPALLAPHVLLLLEVNDNVYTCSKHFICARTFLFKGIYM